jgi:hypothetical protein
MNGWPWSFIIIRTQPLEIFIPTPLKHILPCICTSILNLPLDFVCVTCATYRHVHAAHDPRPQAHKRPTSNKKVFDLVTLGEFPPLTASNHPRKRFIAVQFLSLCHPLAVRCGASNTYLSPLFRTARLGEMSDVCKLSPILNLLKTMSA